MMMEEEDTFDVSQTYEEELVDDSNVVATEAMKWRRPICPLINPSEESLGLLTSNLR